jgi:hypothetical protein
LAQRAQERAAHVFFEALKECYGADFINELRPEENQNHPLTVEEAIELFQKIHEYFKNLAAFFQKQPLLITKEYLDSLLAHPHLARQVEHDYGELRLRERSLLQSMREMVNTGIIFTAHSIPSVGYSHVITAGHFYFPYALGAIAVANITGAAAGLAWSVISGHEQTQMEAAGVSAIFTMESTLGEIATTILFPHSHTAWAVIRDIVASALIGGGISIGVDATAIVNATRNAFVGGSVSGALAVGAGAQQAPNTTSSPRAGADHQQINIEDEVSLEARLGIKGALKIAMNNLSKLVEAINNIPLIQRV